MSSKLSTISGDQGARSIATRLGLALDEPASVVDGATPAVLAQQLGLASSATEPEIRDRVRDLWSQARDVGASAQLQDAGADTLQRGRLSELLAQLPDRLWHEQDSNSYLSPLAVCILGEGSHLQWRLCGVLRGQDDRSLSLIDAFPYSAPLDLASEVSKQPQSVVVLPSAPLDHVFAAIAHHLHGVSPLQLLAGLRGGTLEVTRTSNGSQIPADAEIVLEGAAQRVRHLSSAFVGRFGGYYQATPLHVSMTVEQAAWREQPVLLSHSFCRPPDPLADALSAALEQGFLARFGEFPGLRRVRIPGEGYGFTVLAALEQLYPGQPYQLMHRVWGDRRFSWVKRIVVTEPFVDLANDWELEWSQATLVQPLRDIMMPHSFPPLVGDPSLPGETRTRGSRWGIDATRPLYDYTHEQKEFPALCTDQEIMDQVKAQWGRYGMKWQPRSGSRQTPLPPQHPELQKLMRREKERDAREM